MPPYDPLTLLERANAHAQQWQSALDRAIAQQSAMTNTAFADGFARDRVFRLYPTELDRLQAGNVYQAQQAQMHTRLLPAQEAAQQTAYRLNTAQNDLALQDTRWTNTPENTAARRTLLDDRLQSPAAQLRAGAATYGQFDPVQREATIRNTLMAVPGALSAQANAAAPAAAVQIGQSIDRLLLGETGAADALLQQAGLGRALAQPDGRIVLRDAQGQASRPMSAQEAAVVLQSRTGQAGTPLQAYGAAQTQAAQAAWLKRLEAQAELAREDTQAQQALRMELFKAAADPMATPESRQQLDALAQRFGIDLRGGARRSAPGAMPPEVAQAAGQLPATSAFGAITGLGNTPPIKPQTASSSTATPAIGTSPSHSTESAAGPPSFEQARRSHDAARSALASLIERRDAVQRSLTRLQADIASAGGRHTVYGVVGDGPTLEALRSAFERLREEQRQTEAALREAQTRTQTTTAHLRRLTRTQQDTRTREAREARVQAVYEAYRP